MPRQPLNKRQRLIIRWSVPCGVALLAVSYIVVLGAVREDPAAPAADGSVEGLTSVLSRAISDDMVRFTFEERAADAGIDTVHFPATRGSLLPEDMGSGLAWGDYDDDGDDDLFVVNFRASLRDAADAPAGRCALYRNEGDGSFTDVARETGTDLDVFGMGAAFGDYDGDGDLDLSVTAYGPNVLLRNDGAAFTDVSASAGVDDPGFSAGSTFGDYDGDGDIDLYVCNYVRFDRQDANDRPASQQYGSTIPYTINPSSYRPAPNRLYRNDGDGTFTDVAETAGVSNADGRSLGATWFDFDDDGLVDLYVANDVSDNGVFLNRGDGTFADIGARSLAADYRGAMGLAVGDYEHDGDLDLFVTHWVAQENAFFENMHSAGRKDADGSTRLFFMDAAEYIGLGQISLQAVGWATGFADFDNDANLDLWVVNGSTLEQADSPEKLRPQHMHMLWNKRGEGYYEIAARACPDLVTPFVGRGGAHADYDGDGRVDLAIMRHGATPLLLHNTSTDDHHWVAIRLRQPGGNTRALGARVRVRCGDVTQTMQAGADGSYLSQHGSNLHFGLGPHERIDELTIRWPDGTVDRHEDLSADRVLHFEPASAAVTPARPTAETDVTTERRTDP